MLVFLFGVLAFIAGGLAQHGQWPWWGILWAGFVIGALGYITEAVLVAVGRVYENARITSILRALKKLADQEKKP